MRSIRYSLHFPLLLVGIVLLGLVQNVDLRVRGGGLNLSYFVFMGILHATSIVLSLRKHKAHDLSLALIFIALAAVWSAVAPILALSSSALWPLHEGIGLILIFVAASAIGSAGYWLLVRLFWLKSLRLLDCLRTVALCVAATLLSVGLTMLVHDRDVTPLLFAAAWWFAFSLSLYWSETQRRANAPTPTVGYVSSH